MATGGQLPMQVIAALARGDKLQAAKLLREAGGRGLKEALDAIERQSRPQAMHAGGDDVASNAVAQVRIPETARQAMRDGQAIEAIRQVRAANPGMDLAAAKRAADALRAATVDAGPVAKSHALLLRASAERPPTVAPGDAPGGLRWILLVLGLVALAVWLAMR